MTQDKRPVLSQRAQRARAFFRTLKKVRTVTPGGIKLYAVPTIEQLSKIMADGKFETCQSYICGDKGVHVGTRILSITPIPTVANKMTVVFASCCQDERCLNYDSTYSGRAITRVKDPCRSSNERFGEPCSKILKCEEFIMTDWGHTGPWSLEFCDKELQTELKNYKKWIAEQLLAARRRRMERALFKKLAGKKIQINGIHISDEEVILVFEDGYKLKIANNPKAREAMLCINDVAVKDLQSIDSERNKVRVSNWGKD